MAGERHARAKSGGLSWPLGLLLVTALLIGTPAPGAHAQADSATPGTPDPTTPADAELEGDEASAAEAPPEEPISPHIAEGATLLADMAAVEERFQRLGEEAKVAEGEDRVVFDHQIAKAKLEYLDFIDALIVNLKATEAEGIFESDVREFIDEELPLLSGELVKHIEASESVLRELRKERVVAEQAEIASVEESISRETEWLHELYRGYLRHLGHLQAAGLDDRAVHKDINQRLTTHADRIGGRLTLLTDKLSRLEQQAKESPDNEVLQEEIRVVTARKKAATETLHFVADRLDAVELDSSEYRQLIIRATGEVTADVFKGKVAIGLLQQSLEDSRSWLRANGPALAFKTFAFLLTLMIFRIVAALVTGVFRRGIASGGSSRLLNNMVINLATRAIMLLGLLVALSQVGVELGPLLAGLGIAGFIVGFALQDSLANFAAGVMILGFRPYDEDDLIEAGGVFGTVSYMSLVSTTILTLDNQTLIVPNAKIWGDVIKNVTNQKQRRVDLEFYVSHEEDVERLKRIFTELVESHPKVLADPPPNIQLHKILESTLKFIVRPWVSTEDYWDVYWELTRQVKQRFEREGIRLPHPRRDVALLGAVQNDAETAPERRTEA